MNIIEYIYFYWYNMYNTKSIYRLDVYSNKFEYLDYRKIWTSSDSTPAKLRNLNGKPRILKQLTELSFMGNEEVMEEINKILVMKELIS